MEQALKCVDQFFFGDIVALAKLHEVQNVFVRQGFVHWSCRSSYMNNPARQGNETDLDSIFSLDSRWFTSYAELQPRYFSLTA